MPHVANRERGGRGSAPARCIHGLNRVSVHGKSLRPARIEKETGVPASVSETEALRRLMQSGRRGGSEEMARRDYREARDVDANPFSCGVEPQLPCRTDPGLGMDGAISPRTKARDHLETLKWRGTRSAVAGRNLFLSMVLGTLGYNPGLNRGFSGGP